MGGSLSWEANADSLGEPGKKSVLSSEIAVDAEVLVDGCERYIRGGNTKKGPEAEFEITGGEGEPVTIKQVFNVPALFGGGTHALHHVYKFDKAARSCEHQFFISTQNFEAGIPTVTNKTVVHANPCRVEFWQDAHEVRSSGKVVKGLLEKVLQELGSKVKVHEDHPSVSEPGHKSVLTDAIEPCSLSADNFFTSFKAYLIDTMGATELPDGAVIEERGSAFDVLDIGVKTFAKHVVNTDESKLYCFEYGTDETLTDLVGMTYLQMHKDPFRLEQWNVQEAGRRAGNDQANIIKPFMEKVIAFVQEKQ